MSHNFKTIAIVESCYKEKFAIPRQPGLAPSAKALIRFLPEFAIADAVEGLEGSSHIWLQFIFHKIAKTDWSPKVRPPRLGGNEKLGVFATRSTHRPNPIGLSVVKLESIDISEGIVLEVSGIDLLDGTPIVDIKPYVPYADRIDEASHDFASVRPNQLNVSFSNKALDQLAGFQAENKTDLHKLITEVLQQDPRPAYQQLDSERVYGTHLLNFNLSWRYLKEGSNEPMIEVVGLTETQET